MKQPISLVLILLFTFNYSLTGQQKKDSTPNSKQVEDFYKLKFPKVINDARVDPDANNAIKINLTENKASLKLGKILSNKENQKWVWSGFFQGGLKATNGVTTLFKEDNVLEYSLIGGISINKSTNFVKTNDKQDVLKSWAKTTGLFKEDSLVTRHNNWFSFRAEYKNSNLGLIDEVQQTFSKETYNSYAFFISYNNYFRSALKKHAWKNSIVSMGIGYVKVNNYDNLSKHTFEQGTITIDSTNSTYTGISKPKTGKLLSEFKQTMGAGAYLEYFVPLNNGGSDDGLNTFFGVRLVGNNIFDDNESIYNAFGGFYFNLKNGKDEANFSIVARLNDSFNRLVYI